MPLCGQLPHSFSLCCEFVQGAWDWQEPIPRHRAFRVRVCVFQNHIWAQRGATSIVVPGGLWESGALAVCRVADDEFCACVRNSYLKEIFFIMACSLNHR